LAILTSALVGCGGSPTTSAATASIEISPLGLNLSVGDISQLVATPKTRDGISVQSPPGSLVWTSSAPHVAEVSLTGTVVAISAGFSEISASIGTVSGSILVAVNPASVAAVEVLVHSSQFTVGQQVSLSSVLRDRRGNQIHDRPVTWHSGNPCVVSVSQSGEVRGVTAGAAEITASSEGVSSTVTLTVNHAPFSPPGALVLNNYSVLDLPSGGVRFCWNKGESIQSVWVFRTSRTIPVSGPIPFFNSPFEGLMPTFPSTFVSGESYDAAPPSAGNVQFLELSPRVQGGNIWGPIERLTLVPVGTPTNQLVALDVFHSSSPPAGTIVVMIYGHHRANFARYAYNVGVSPGFPTDNQVLNGSVVQMRSGIGRVLLPPGTLGLGQRIRVRAVAFTTDAQSGNSSGGNAVEGEFVFQ